MIIVVPADNPDIVPLVTPMVATAVLLLLHVPPGELLLIVIDDPAQTPVAPVITADAGFTVTIVVTVQPKPNE